METEEIVKRTKANDAAALAMLVEAYSSKARAVCFGITHEDEELRLVMAPSTFNNNIIIPAPHSTSKISLVCLFLYTFAT